ncbi:TerB family tellurite resistance protein [Marinoscillum sp. MHG1-6]|uniref:TerB family tellurite resistance protein n=1 Tax=Marinoscillum sp. MHG1-6 TaxID=2959627 RepID=UPI002157A962|nr:TerB family tellurite resistance protein [Marinoscillum sp. MHG1-6]
MDSALNVVSPVFYGISLVPRSLWRVYGYTLLTIAGSDGIVSDPELEWLTMDLAGKVGVPDEIIEDWEAFDYDMADLEELFSSFNSSTISNFSKLLLYDAIRMSYADGEYALEEKEKVMQAAQMMNVSIDSVVAIEALVDLEQAAEKLRMTLF